MYQPIYIISHTCRLTAKYKDVFCNEMMVHELGLQPPSDEDSPIKNGMPPPPFSPYSAHNLVSLKILPTLKRAAVCLNLKIH